MEAQETIKPINSDHDNDIQQTLLIAGWVWKHVTQWPRFFFSQIKLYLNESSVFLFVFCEPIKDKMQVCNWNFCLFIVFIYVY